MFEKITQSKISRRSFLKGSTLVLAGLSSGIGVSSLKAFATGNSTDANNEVWKSSFCAGCHLPVCATKVKIVNGVLTEVKGDPNSETNQGHLCTRGMTFPYNIYNPYRVKCPMKRTNPEKGLDQDPKWVEITWDEAINTVAEKLKEVRNTDPRSFLVTPGFGFEEGFMAFEVPFAVGFGTPNLIETPGLLCPEHFAGLHYNGHMLDRIDLEYVKYLVVVGRNFGADWVASSGATLHYAEALEKGLHVVNVNPISRTSAHKGEWVPILPGTDTAFGLALVYTILHEIGKYDEWFLKVRSNAPYLIEDKPEIIKDTLVYQQDYMRDSVTSKPLVWDEVQNCAVPFDSSKGEDYALTGTYTVNGVEVKPTFQLLKDYVVKYTPEWAEKITTIPAAKIREIANNLINEAHIGATIDLEGYTFPHRGAAIYTGRGCSTHMMGTEAYKALGTVNLLLGSYDVPGGMLGTESASWATLKADEDGELKASNFFYTQVVGAPFVFPPQKLDLTGMYPMKHNMIYMVWKSIMEPEKYSIEYPVKVMMLHAANPITSMANDKTAIEALKKIDFIFNIAYHFDEPSQFCDVLLPEHHSVERVGMYRNRWNQKEATNQYRWLYGTLKKKPALESRYDTRHAEYILMAIDNTVG
ncbi:MAG: molybdopterin-dependent oxidoreductase, partial [Eubacteriales bacterium]